MAITKPKLKAPQNAEAFIAGAPDAEASARAKAKGVMLGHKRQITLTISPELLAKVDEMASEMGQARAAIINLAIYRAVEHGLTIDRVRKSE
ncbi:MAG: hypothetical protein H7834_14890 [Magnetococcus sp. YQC-9]